MRSMVKQTSRMAARHGGIQPRCAGLSPRRAEMSRPVVTRPLWMQRVSGSYNFFYFHDGNKNVSDLVSYQTARGVPAHYEYAPFGAVTSATTNTAFSAFNVADTNPYRFSSEYADDAIGLVYYNYRHYNPLDGRWTSRDPKYELTLEFGSVQIIFGFCGNSPVDSNDSLGKEFFAKCDGNGGGIVGWSFSFEEIGKGLDFMSDVTVDTLSGLDRIIRYTASGSGSAAKEAWELPSKIVAYPIAGVSMLLGAEHHRLTYRDCKGGVRSIDLYTGGHLMRSDWGMTPSSSTIFLGSNFYSHILAGDEFAIERLKHECGHIIQAETLGPFYLPLVVPFTGWSYGKPPFSWAEDWADGFIENVSTDDIDISPK